MSRSALSASHTPCLQRPLRELNLLREAANALLMDDAMIRGFLWGTAGRCVESAQHRGWHARAMVAPAAPEAAQRPVIRRHLYGRRVGGRLDLRRTAERARGGRLSRRGAGTEAPLSAWATGYAWRGGVPEGSAEERLVLVAAVGVHGEGEFLIR